MNPTSRTWLRVLALALAAFATGNLLRARAADSAPRLPNIVLVYADDLGWGDTGCYGARAIPTPNIDRLAKAGLRFTDAHATSATCTPSRYALMTGEYPWRRKGTGVLPGDAALIVEPGRTTLPSMLRQAGYATGVVGKWHLGLGSTNLNWNAEIRPGPLEIGFDSAFVMAATGDRVPCVYVENHRVANLDPADPIHVRYGAPVGQEPTGKDHPELLRLRPSHGHDQTIVNGISRIGYMTGGRSARWNDETMADTFAAKAGEFVRRHRDRPFFLYFALHDPHVPRTPHPRHVGKTRLGPRGDAIVQADASVGALLDVLDDLRLATDTLVLFTSDNGAVVDDGYQDRAVELLADHRPNGPWRGGKYSKFEAGTRVPFVVRWPGRIAPGVSDALVSQVDLLATLASLVGRQLAPGDAPDSRDILPALLGRSPIGRDHLVEHANGLALRQGSWKFIPESPGAAIAWQTGIETGNSEAPQLYDLSIDPAESRNLAADDADRVAAMRKFLSRIRQQESPRTP
ncbi:MAG: arylsulfatase [Verrucomicrobiales bacterium]|nr:arylsulfatase [Verrucomicrobiales bacterium]